MTTVCLHIGTMKSGTSFLQRALGRNKSLLLQHRIQFPGSRWRDQVRAVEEVIGGPPGKEPTQGAWQRLVDEVRAYDGTTSIISMEGLASATSEQARRVAASFQGQDVTVIVTARDLARVLPAQWQEGVKSGKSVSFDQFLAALSVPGSRRLRFWEAQDVPRIIRRWQSVPQVGRVALVTVPPSPASRELLWARFAEAAGIPELPVDLDVTGNESLGLYSVEFLRRLNKRLSDKNSWRLRRSVKQQVANRILRSRPRAEPRIEVPAEYHPWVARTAEKFVAELKALDISVYGELDDLLIADWKSQPGSRIKGLSHVVGRQSSSVDERELLDVALFTIERLLDDELGAAGAQHGQE